MQSYAVEIGKHRIALSPGLFRIGRDPLCEIHLNADSISRRHASLRIEEHRVLLLDHGSRNGVLVNGVRVYGEVEIQAGDRIEIGTEILILLDREEPTSVIPNPTKPLPRIPPRTVSALGNLSGREREVFERLARGETHREIGERLGLSIKTVDTYRSRVYDKLAVHSRADLIRLALDLNVLK